MTTHENTTNPVGTGPKRPPTPRKHASGKWRVDFRYVNARNEKKQKTLYGDTKSEVIDKYQEFLDRLLVEFPESNLPAIREYAQAWINGSLERSDRADSTKESYASSLISHLRDAPFGFTPIDMITAKNVDDWNHWCRTEKVKNARRWSDSTNRSAFVALVKCLDDAVRDGMIDNNPARGVERPKIREQQHGKPLDKADLDYLLRCARESRYGLVLELMAAIGMRRGEALALTWSAIDFKRQVFHVDQSTRRRTGEGLQRAATKTPKSKRTLPITPEVAAIFRTAKERQDVDRAAAGREWVETDLVFTTKIGQSMDPRNVNRALAAAAKRAGMEGVGSHRLRHTFATMMMDKGVPERYISEMLGHEDVLITRIYETVKIDGMRDALAKLNDRTE